MNNKQPSDNHPNSEEFPFLTSELSRHMRAPNTLRVYRRALSSLQDWLELTHRNLDDATLSDYCIHLHNKGLVFSSINVVCAAVRFNCGLKGKPVVKPEANVLNAIRRSQITRFRAPTKGLKHEDASFIAQQIKKAGDVKSLRDAAIIMTTSDCLLRVSEVASIEISDVHFGEDGSGRLLIRHSKTDQNGDGSVLYLGAVTCTYIRHWLTESGIVDGKLYRRLSKSGQVVSDSLSSRSICSIIQERAKRSGFDGKISGHSLRVGTAESLAERGASLTQLMTAGRWRSPVMPAFYTRNEQASRSAVAKLLYGAKKNTS